MSTIARAVAVVGSLYALLRNRLGLNVATPLGAQELSATIAPDRRLVVLGHDPIAGFSRDHGTVADEAAMLALHTLDSTTLIAEPRFVAPGDSCLRADDPGWRWHCLAGNGTTLTQWERRPIEGALSGLGGVPTSRTVNGHALSSNVTVSASDLGLGSVENSALSTWTGSANLSTVGTISSGTWHGTALADTYIVSAAAWNAKVSFPGFGTTAGTAAEGNDARLSDARTPLSHTQTWSTITSTPTTLAGYGITDSQSLDTDLTALAGLSTTGLVARTGSGTAATRTITGTANQVTVTNGDGIAGNPTLSLPQGIATSSTPQFRGVSVVSTAPALQLKGPSTSAVGRLYESDVNAGSVDLTSNASYDGAYWQRDDTTHPSTVVKAWDGKFTVRRAAAGANPATLSVSLALSETGALQLGAYGAGTLVTDSSGNVTASSDATLKTVTGSFTRGLNDVLKLTPRTYHWNAKSGMDTEDENVGFIAQEVLTAVPEAVGQYRTSEFEVDGKKTKKREKAELLTLSDRPLIAALVNAVRELNEKNTALEARVAALENGKASK